MMGKSDQSNDADSHGGLWMINRSSIPQDEDCGDAPTRGMLVDDDGLYSILDFVFCDSIMISRIKRMRTRFDQIGTMSY